MPPLTTGRGTAMCPPGKRLLGGGAQNLGMEIEEDFAVDGSGFSVAHFAFNPANAKGWEAAAFNGNVLESQQFVVFAICANV